MNTIAQYLAAGATMVSSLSPRQQRSPAMATLPYVLQLAQQGLTALRDDPGFGKGVNTSQGYVTSKPVAEALGLLSQFKEFATL
jgi:alanine dehydrogenase